ncbi:tyrosine phosphatase family-domain-containing protein [Lophiotrema nucula]|uniref:Tyrosine phosphatase family-domain-containing protein n=1 Tax=Lophiotrema nucula TaxID=690887 RepID=A0A6A5YKR4_9PLEO|nr:tyrosine phosphatase family-domain-containing protein [Lophiotrema nucula]
MTTHQNPPLPQPPFYTIPNINNLRDPALFPGGLPIGADKKVRPNILFRSAEVSKLDRGGWKAVKALGVAHVFDLRSKPEEAPGKDGEEDVRAGWIEDMAAEGVERSWVPVFEDSDYSPDRLAERYMKYMDESIEGFAMAYKDILQHAHASFRPILLYLASLPEPDPRSEAGAGVGALVHCTAGKDRTGIFFGVLFDFLGVERDVIAEEFNLTELGLRHIRDGVVGRLMQSPGLKMYMLSKASGKEIGSEELEEVLKKGGDGIGEQEIPPEILEQGRQAGMRMVGARKESMLRALEMVDEEWGGSEKYIRSVLGLGDEHLDKLRRTLVVPA